jgi:tRNA-dihydrouridine synthase B
MTWHIGAVPIEGRVALAPMAGTTDSPFRRICKRFGAALVFTELVSAEGLIRNRERTGAYLEFAPDERPIAVQFFGADPKSMHRAIGEAMEWAPDIIDVNLGCPTRKVVKKGAGAALLKDMSLMREVVSAAVEASCVPVTVKLRSGWDDRSVIAVEAAVSAVSLGTAAVTLHPRTRAMGFSGKADWGLIREVVASVSVPVIGSGDVHSPDDAVRMARETGCAAVMIGRAARGNPWLLRDASAVLEGSPMPPSPTLEATLSVAHEHVALHRETYAGRKVRDLAAQLCWYVRGLPGASRWRARLFAASGYDELESVLSELGGVFTQ